MNKMSIIIIKIIYLCDKNKSIKDTLGTYICIYFQIKLVIKPYTTNYRTQHYMNYKKKICITCDTH